MNVYHVLVVDDDQPIRELVAEALLADGFLVQVAISGRDAMLLIQKRAPDLILLDLRMPDGNGWKLGEFLRAAGHSIPIIVMTAAPDGEQWAKDIGARGFIAKPFDLGDLLSAVNRVCKSLESVA